jgi:hypothetical protein
MYSFFALPFYFLNTQPMWQGLQQAMVEQATGFIEE